MTLPVLGPAGWECPKCGQAVANRGQKGTPFHSCPRMGGLQVPLVPAGTKADLKAVERGDWVGRETVTTDADGRPVMAVVTTRDDGQDCTVYAPCATGVSD